MFVLIRHVVINGLIFQYKVCIVLETKGQEKKKLIDFICMLQAFSVPPEAWHKQTQNEEGEDSFEY
jgi:hypothetical protein